MGFQWLAWKTGTQYLVVTYGEHSGQQMARACMTYKGIERKPFVYVHCWVMLADHPKWHAHEAAKAQKMQEGDKAHSSPAECNEVPNDATSNTSIEISRPIGR
ncbi:uncharacterized protein LOC133924103 [Phragmites australis]|uniref:uncharacterized protein LOC133924103 n=1 Tax=Phragmites australis TaxID=29695 RepID=UPI002D79EC58|nr:uncharacterized protein LOC133924103 [Phragmites australis]